MKVRLKIIALNSLLNTRWLLSIFIINSLFPQSIQNIRVEQIEDTLLVRYDIFGGREYDTFKLDMMVSNDGGKNFNITPQSAKGDIGFGRTRGLKKYISWEPLKDSIELDGANYVVQLTGEVLGTSADIKFVSISAGEFEMGDHFEEGSSDEMVKRNVKLNSFEISTFEVTNLQYSKFLNEYGSNTLTSGEFKGEEMIYAVEGGVNFYQGEWKPDAGFEYHPVIGVTWYGANEFCEFYGFGLPTEAEWEYAAKDRGSNIRFGNGKNIADPSEINFNGTLTSEYKFANTGDGRNMTTNVGTFPPNKTGLFQMSGNVWEWCQDWYASDYYIKGELENPSGPSFGKYKVIRGGSWANSGSAVRVTERSFYLPYGYNKDIGFRVVKRINN